MSNLSVLQELQVGGVWLGYSIVLARFGDSLLCSVFRSLYLGGGRGSVYDDHYERLLRL